MYEKINDHTTVVVVTNPNNPTSTVVDHDALADFVRSRARRGYGVHRRGNTSTIRSDPDYRDAMYLGPRARERDRLPDVLQDLRPCRIARSDTPRFSPRLRRKAVALQPGRPPGQPWVSTPPSPRWTIKPITSGAAGTVEEGKAYLGKSFERLGIPYTPSDACFVLFQLGDEAERVFNALQERKVWIGDAMWWGLKGISARDRRHSG